MENLVPRIQSWAKRGLAIILFIVLLVGASATAFYVLAAGISALSGFAGRTVIAAPTSFVQPATDTSSSDYANSQGLVRGAAGTNGAVVQTPSRSVQGVPTPTIDSSVSEAIDGGGFALGNQVQHAFGSLLGGVLNTLFLNQPATSNATGGN